MLRLIFLFSCGVAAVSARGSPNADKIKRLYTPSLGLKSSNDILEDASLDAPDLIAKYGYPVEIHEVKTSDGYILEMHRIPHGRGSQPGPRPVVFIMHGLLSSSADFLVLGPGSALGYLLAEEGYDVWLGNARGNYYSRRHTSLNPDSRISQEFWKFSWEQIGRYDVPASIDYIIEKTGQQKLHYIGHSQGGTSFLVLNCLLPEYNDKFISLQALAPASYFTYNENSVFNALAPLEKVIEATFFSVGYGEITTDTAFLNWVSVNFCGNDAESVFQPLCAESLLNADSLKGYYNETLIPVFLGHIPAGASIRQVAHFGQTIRNDRFARFDYNAITNLLTYGTSNPPEFDLSKVTVPAYLYYGLADKQVDYRDVKLLAQRLGNTVVAYQAERDSFNHFDFIWGNNIKEEIFDKLFENMRSAENL